MDGSGKRPKRVTSAASDTVLFTLESLKKTIDLANEFLESQRTAKFWAGDYR